MPYLYMLTPTQLRSSTNPWIDQYYKKFAAEGAEHGENITNGMELLLTDTPRIRINGSPGKELKDLNLKAEDVKNFEALINKCYQQDLLHTAVSPLAAHQTLGTEATNLSFIAKDKTHDLYREEKTGEIYLKTTVQFFQIPADPSAYLPGPVEVLHKLDENGFVLQHVATNSAVIYGAYLGNSLNKRQDLFPELKRNEAEATGHLSNEAALIKNTLEKIKSDLDKQSPDKDGLIQAARDAVRFCLDNKMSIPALQQRLQKLSDLPDVEQKVATKALGFFMGKLSTTDALKAAVYKLNSIIPEAAKKQFASPAVAHPADLKSSSPPSPGKK